MPLAANNKNFERLSLVTLEEFCDLLDESDRLDRAEAPNLIAHAVDHPRHGHLTLVNSPGGCIVIFD